MSLGQGFLLAHLLVLIPDDSEALSQSPQAVARHQKADVAFCVFWFSSQRSIRPRLFLLPFSVCLSSLLLVGQKEDSSQCFCQTKAENPGKQFLVFFSDSGRQIVSVSSNQNPQLARFRLAEEVVRKELSKENSFQNRFSQSGSKIFLS